MLKNEYETFFMSISSEERSNKLKDILKKQEISFVIEALKQNQKDLDELLKQENPSEEEIISLREKINDALEKIAESGIDLDEYFKPEITFDLKTIDFNVVRKAYPISYAKEIEIEMPMEKPKNSLSYISYIFENKEAK